MSEDNFQDSVAALDALPLSEQTAAAVALDENARTLSLAARSLQLGIDTLDYDRDTFIDEVADLFEESTEALHDIQARERFTGRLLRLLSISSLLLKGKAASLLSEGQRFGITSRIITDIRPVFNADFQNVALSGAIIVHTLKLEYFESSVRKTFFIQLEPSDVTNLKVACERAEMKQEGLIAFLKSTDVPLVEPFDN